MQYIAQIRVGDGPWCNTRVVESPGVALAIAHDLAKHWLHSAEGRFIPVESAESRESFMAAVAEWKAIVRKFKRKHKTPEAFDAYMEKALADAESSQSWADAIQESDLDVTDLAESEWVDNVAHNHD